MMGMILLVQHGIQGCYGWILVGYDAHGGVLDVVIVVVFVVTTTACPHRRTCLGCHGFIALAKGTISDKGRNLGQANLGVRRIQLMGTIPPIR